MRPADHELIYDWNQKDQVWPRPARVLEFDDETLRDGLQSPSVTSSNSSTRAGRGQTWSFWFQS